MFFNLYLLMFEALTATFHLQWTKSKHCFSNKIRIQEVKKETDENSFFASLNYKTELFFSNFCSCLKFWSKVALMIRLSPAFLCGRFQTPLTQTQKGGTLGLLSCKCSAFKGFVERPQRPRWSLAFPQDRSSSSQEDGLLFNPFLHKPVKSCWLAWARRWWRRRSCWFWRSQRVNLFLGNGRGGFEWRAPTTERGIGWGWGRICCRSCAETWIRIRSHRGNGGVLFFPLPQSFVNSTERLTDKSQKRRLEFVRTWTFCLLVEKDDRCRGAVVMSPFWQKCSLQSHVASALPDLLPFTLTSERAAAPWRSPDWLLHDGKLTFTSRSSTLTLLSPETQQIFTWTCLQPLPLIKPHAGFNPAVMEDNPSWVGCVYSSELLRSSNLHVPSFKRTPPRRSRSIKVWSKTLFLTSSCGLLLLMDTQKEN